jgi:hypothetical protein
MMQKMLTRSLALMIVGAAAPLAAQQPVPPSRAAVRAPADSAHPAPPVRGRALQVPMNVDRIRAQAAAAPAARPAPVVSAQRSTRPEPTLAEKLAATAPPTPRGDALPPLPADQNPAQLPPRAPAPAAVQSRSAPTPTQLLNAPGARPANATARCKDGTYLTNGSPTDADCATHAGLAVFFPARAAVRQ